MPICDESPGTVPSAFWWSQVPLRYFFYPESKYLDVCNQQPPAEVGGISEKPHTCLHMTVFAVLYRLGNQDSLESV